MTHAAGPKQLPCRDANHPDPAQLPPPRPGPLAAAAADATLAMDQGKRYQGAFMNLRGIQYGCVVAMLAVGCRNSEQATGDAGPEAAGGAGGADAGSDIGCEA